jgi:hypothetical protein
MDDRDLTVALRALGFETSHEPVELTGDQAAAVARGDRVGSVEPVEEHPDYPGWDADATPEQIAEGKGVEATSLEAGERGFVVPVERFAAQDPVYARELQAAAQARHEARIAGRPQPPLPEPPKAAVEAHVSIGGR